MDLTKKNRIRITNSFVILLTMALLLLMLFPFFVMLVSMLKTSKEIYHIPPYWLPKHPTLKNFSLVWNTFPLAAFFRNSLIIALGTVALNTFISVPAGYAVARLHFPGKKFILFAFLITQMFSPVVVVISLFKIIIKIHLIDTYLSVIIANAVFTTPFVIWMLNGYFSGIPKGIEDAARIDGCSRVGALLRVILPIAAPGLVTTIIYTFIYGWNDFIFSLSFLQTGNKYPLTMGLYQFVGRFAIQWEQLLAAAFLAILPVLILFFLVEKQLVSGLAGGAVKE
ncbi:MAG: carbohydrate ABC transporter permease [Spirochaetes bacterium]|nr:MAG: carbohydrate ABC transporter permease [Spirochaetota bacterium]RKX80310.1 MAG: carbohydrate ABC transporter permease [Spirochaetota bacterium]RKX89614.1 MAG: carbohydrate ABC transporter permease [Spirochaetota bacterium]RKX98181.1 MAG: carbohydrate ABC transporter permease [Spirochaetota bacterium]